MDFIEITMNGDLKYLLAKDHIKFVADASDYRLIALDNEVIKVSETFEELKERLGLSKCLKSYLKTL